MFAAPRLLSLSILIACIPTGFWAERVSAQDNPVQVASLVTETVKPSKAPAKVGYVLLRNQRILEGSAKRVGNEIFVRRSDGSELRLKHRDVIGWAASKRDLYQFRLKMRRSNSVSAHLSDASWCLQNDLLDLAIVELKAIQKVDPKNKSAARLQRQLYYSVLAKRRVLNPSQADPIDNQGNIAQVSYEEDTKEPEPDPQTLGTFVHSIQSILVNRCGGCHSQTSDLKFKLSIPTRGSRPSASMARDNLAMVSKYISFQVPLESELRLRAIDGHAGAKNTLSLGSGRAVESLEQWLTNARPPGSPLELAKQSYTQPAQKPATLRSESGELTQSPHSEHVIQSPGSPQQPEPARRLPQVSNPFDPEIFNRRMRASKSLGDREN